MQQPHDQMGNVNALGTAEVDLLAGNLYNSLHLCRHFRLIVYAVGHSLGILQSLGNLLLKRQ